MRLNLGVSFFLIPLVMSLLVVSSWYSPVLAQTPTPVIRIHLYQDPLDDTVQVVGGMCQRQGFSAVAQPVLNATAEAFSSTLAETFPATSLSDELKVVLNHSDSVDDYRVTVLLPTPAPGHTGPLYICSCPYSNGQDYVCQYSTIDPNETVNVFVTDVMANESWWQVHGGQVYSKYRIRSRIPVEACEMSGTCIPSLLVAEDGPDSVGFVSVGPAGLIETDRNGSDDYIHQVGDRTTSGNGYATGLDQQRIDYAYYYQAYRNHMADFASLSELQTLISAQAHNTSELYYYVGPSPFVIDQTNTNSPLNITNGKKVTVFIPANLEFRNTYGTPTPHLSTVDDESFLGFFVAGNVTVAAEVGYSNIATNPETVQANLTAVLVTDGQVTIASDNDPDVTDRKFVGEGTFVAWDKNEIGNGFVMRRNFDNAVDGKTLNSRYPSEVFRFRPEFMAYYPTELKITAQNWQEIAPQR